MSEEIEIKLRVAPEAMRPVLRLAWLREMAGEPARRHKLVATYFDTGKFKLRDHGIVLRIRREGRAFVQAIKAEADGTGAAFGRRQWERRVALNWPELDDAGDTALTPILSDALKRKLRPVFRTEIWRTALPVVSGGSRLEIALDRGWIVAGEAKEEVGEIEIELISGDPAEVVRLAERLAAAVPVTYEARMKPERGYLIAAGLGGKAFNGKPVVLAATVTAEECFRHIGFTCLHHLTANEQAVCAGDSKGIHQMRVGLRRLRAAISLFRDLARDSRCEAVKAELRWLTEQLGPARDFDVFVRESVEPLSDERHGASEIQVLRQDLEARRDAGFARAKAAIESERYRKLTLDVAFWLAGGEWSKTRSVQGEARRRRPASAFAAETLTRRTRKIAKQLGKLDELDARQRHELRIGVKKLRYATEFFTPLFAGRVAGDRRERFLKALKELQDSLGKLNDIGVQQRLAVEIMQSGEQPDKLSKKAYAMGIVTGRSHIKYEASIAAAVRAGRRLASGRQFWQ